MGKGNHTTTIDPNAKDCQKFLTDSKIARDAYLRAIRYNRDTSQENVVVLLGIQWSDDFEPNTSSKTNRGSVWMKTVTFISDDIQLNNLKNTYPISLGLKSNDHDVVENAYVRETLELSTGINNTFYSMFLKRNVKVHCEIIACLADQPERRSINKMMLGNSLFFLDSYIPQM